MYYEITLNAPNKFNEYNQEGFAIRASRPPTEEEIFKYFPNETNSIIKNCLKKVTLHMIEERTKEELAADYYDVDYIDQYNTLETNIKLSKINKGYFNNKLKWISRHVIRPTETIDLVVCPQCREEFSFDYETGISMHVYSYCPNCGTKLGD